MFSRSNRFKPNTALSSKQRIITTDLLDAETQAPAPLNLPFGKLFFGFKSVPYKPPAEGSKSPGGHEVSIVYYSLHACLTKSRSLHRSLDQEIL